MSILTTSISLFNKLLYFLHEIMLFMKTYNTSNHVVCVHGFIDGNDGTVYQCLPWNYRAYHCGGSANNTHIGIEMCEPSSIKYISGSNFTVKNKKEAVECCKRTYNAAVSLFAKLCKEYKLNLQCSRCA